MKSFRNLTYFVASIAFFCSNAILFAQSNPEEQLIKDLKRKTENVTPINFDSDRGSLNEQKNYYK